MACELQAQGHITELWSSHKGLQNVGEGAEGSRLDHSPSPTQPSRLHLFTLLELLDLHQFSIYSTWKLGITWFELAPQMVYPQGYHNIYQTLLGQILP